MANPLFNQSDNVLLTKQKRQDQEQLPPNFDLCSDGFNLWWNRTIARHTAVIAQASELIRTHRSDSYPTGTRTKQSHGPNL
jgi:hypothetical protein